MEYLLVWRTAVVKNLLRNENLAIAELADRAGYGSASIFSTAFSRYFGQPLQYARQHTEVADASPCSQERRPGFRVGCRPCLTM